MDQMDNAVHDAVERVIANAKIPVSGDDDVNARLQRLQPAIVEAIINVAELTAGHSYNVRVAAQPGPRHRRAAAKPVPPYWTWHVAMHADGGELVWYGEGYL